MAHLAFDCESAIEIDDINDDFKRESALYEPNYFKVPLLSIFHNFSIQQALETVVAARKIIIAAKIPFHRPEGYFCEMLKTDEQISNITRKKAEEKAALKAAEDARKQRLNRKYGKKIQVEREVEKQQKRSEEMQKLNKLRKRPFRDEEMDDFEVKVDEENSIMRDGKAGAKKPKRGSKPNVVSQKRKARNEKYGFGGKKCGLKKNDKNSVDQDNFDANKNRRDFRGLKLGKKSRFGHGRNRTSSQRPGKQRRQQARSKKASYQK